MTSTWIELSIDGSTAKTYLATPDGPGPHPGAVVAQHAGGVDTFIRSFCDRLAEAGYAAIAPNMYHRQDGMDFEELAKMPQDHPDRWDTMMGKAQQMTDDGIVADMNAGFAHLAGMPEVDGNAIGVTGFCGGGRVAYLMAARNPGFKASAVFHGGAIMNARGHDGASPFDLTSDISCPVAGFFGKDDQNPSPDDVAKISAEMDKFNKPHQFHSYEATGHSFLDQTNPRAYREKSGADAWEKLKVFFGEQLKVSAGVAS
ncbi:MAG: dienelactone hydrolase family protein [Dehalococcoidia bacterium]